MPDCYAIVHQMLSDELHRIQRNVRDAQDEYYAMPTEAANSEFNYWCAKLDGFYLAYELFEVGNGVPLSDVENKI